MEIKKTPGRLPLGDKQVNGVFLRGCRGQKNLKLINNSSWMITKLRGQRLQVKQNSKNMLSM